MQVDGVVEQPKQRAVFFVFEGNEFDTILTPNKITLHGDKPTVLELSNGLKKLFKIEYALSLSFRSNSGNNVTYPDNSSAEVPVDRQNVVLVRLTGNLCFAVT